MNIFEVRDGLRGELPSHITPEVHLTFQAPDNHEKIVVEFESNRDKACKLLREFLRDLWNDTVNLEKVDMVASDERTRLYNGDVVSHYLFQGKKSWELSKNSKKDISEGGLKTIEEKLLFPCKFYKNGPLGFRLAQPRATKALAAEVESLRIENDGVYGFGFDDVLKSIEISHEYRDQKAKLEIYRLTDAALLKLARMELAAKGKRQFVETHIQEKLEIPALV
ncbi:MAG: hypothetical protein FWC00_03480 [Firmicutes bacterium]|nr:hypothetical protein [Bacillota bacterium]